MVLKKSNIFPVNRKVEVTTLFGLYEVTTQPNSSSIHPGVVPPCKWILYEDINDTKVRIWDLIILIPNVVFALFLLIKVWAAYSKLKSTKSPIFTAFYLLVWIVVGISLIRCVASMAVYPLNIADKVLWLILRFFLLATEFSVVVFGIAFGHLDSKTSIRMVLFVTSLTALIYSTIQGLLEFLMPDERFNLPLEDEDGGEDYDIFGHGGMLFWFSSSIIFFVVYTVIVLLPYTKLRERLNLPTRKSFYRYCGYLATLNLIQSAGSGTLYYNIDNAMCVVDVTAYLYFTCFAPLVYWTFLRAFFRNSQTSLRFSYKAQVDDGREDDDVSLPYQTAIQAGKTEDIADLNASFDSTHLDTSGVDVIIHSDNLQETKDHSNNPLYDMSVNSDFFNQNEVT